MIAIYERRITNQEERLWAARYRNLQNIAHWHDACELVFCESVGCTVHIDGQILQLKPTESAFIHGGSVHKIVSEPQSTVITVMIDDKILKGITDRLRLTSAKLKNFTDVPQFYRFIRNELLERKSFYPMILKAEAQRFVAEIFRNNPTEPYSEPNKNAQYTLVHAVLKEVEDNYRYIGFEETACKFGYSPAHFSRLFSSFTGMSFTAYVNAVRLEHCIHELQTEPQKSITQISIDSGFSSIRNFNRYFKLSTGYAPRDLPKTFSYDSIRLNLFPQALDPTQPSSVLLD